MDGQDYVELCGHLYRSPASLSSLSSQTYSPDLLDSTDSLDFLLNLLCSHPENHLRAVRKKPCLGGGSPVSVFASASIAVKNCEAIIRAAPRIMRWPTLAIVPPTCTSPAYFIIVASPCSSKSMSPVPFKNPGWPLPSTIMR